MSNSKTSGKGRDSSKNRRSSSRLAAVQALYQMDVAQVSLNEVLKEFVEFRLGKEVEGEHLSKADTGFFTDLLTGIVREQRKLDPLIDKHLASSWRLHRIDSTLRAILRAGAYELVERTDVPHAVVISEYVDVAHAFFERDEPKVVNGVLQNLWKTAQAAAEAGIELEVVTKPVEPDQSGVDQVKVVETEAVATKPVEPDQSGVDQVKVVETEVVATKPVEPDQSGVDQVKVVETEAVDTKLVEVKPVETDEAVVAESTETETVETEAVDVKSAAAKFLETKSIAVKTDMADIARAVEAQKSDDNEGGS